MFGIDRRSSFRYFRNRPNATKLISQTIHGHESDLSHVPLPQHRLQITCLSVQLQRQTRLMPLDPRAALLESLCHLIGPRVSRVRQCTGKAITLKTIALPRPFALSFSLLLLFDCCLFASSAHATLLYGDFLLALLCLRSSMHLEAVHLWRSAPIGHNARRRGRHCPNPAARLFGASHVA